MKRTKEITPNRRRETAWSDLTAQISAPSGVGGSGRNLLRAAVKHAQNWRNGSLIDLENSSGSHNRQAPDHAFQIKTKVADRAAYPTLSG